MRFHVLEMRFADPGHVQLSTDLDGLAHPLGIILFPFFRHILQFDLPVDTAIAGRVVAEAVQRGFTGVEARLA